MVYCLNTSNFVKNTPLQVVFSTLFSVFRYPDETLSLVFDILLHRFCSISDPGKLKGCSAMAFSSTAVLLTWHSSSKDNGLQNKRNFSVREYVACTFSLWLRVWLFSPVPRSRDDWELIRKRPYWWLHTTDPCGVFYWSISTRENCLVFGNFGVEPRTISN